MQSLKLLPLLLLSTIANASPLATASAIMSDGGQAKLNRPYHIVSYHSAYISNDLPYTVMFYFENKVCVDSQNNCSIVRDQLGLAQGQYYTYHYTGDNNQTFHKSGDHYLYAYTTVTGGAYAIASDSKKILAIP